MELDWTTFALEILNFLILVWILSRFLYKPVLGIIEQRRTAIESTLSEARRLKDEALALQQQYEQRETQWRQERERAREELKAELEGERKRQLDTLHTALAQEREKVAGLERRRAEEAAREMQANATRDGCRFTARLLSALAGPDVERRIVDLAASELTALTPAQQQRLREGLNEAADVRITTAHPLSPENRERLTDALRRVTGLSVSPGYEVDAGLIAGVRMSVGAWSLRANLRDELTFFAEMGSHADAHAH